LDNSQYLIIYDYEYARDAAFPEDKRNGITMLQVGKRYNRFMDYNEFRFDSLMDATAKNLKPYSETGPMMMMALKKRKFRENIVIDKQNNTEIIQRTAGLVQRYQYDEPCPMLKWELAEGDTIIAGYNCKKALTSLWGRDYIAWYAPEVDLPYGPYKFNGLPGLVFMVVDTHDNHKFTLSGLEKVTQYNPIYLWAEKDIIKTSRNKVRKIYKNYCADPVGALTSNGDIIVPDDVKATVNSKPYNPIELE
jgi:GLPGLI family protein